MLLRNYIECRTISEIVKINIYIKYPRRQKKKKGTNNTRHFQAVTIHPSSNRMYDFGNRTRTVVRI